MGRVKEVSLNWPIYSFYFTNQIRNICHTHTHTHPHNTHTHTHTYIYIYILKLYCRHVSVHEYRIQGEQNDSFKPTAAEMLLFISFVDL